MLLYFPVEADLTEFPEMVQGSSLADGQTWDSSGLNDSIDCADYGFAGAQQLRQVTTWQPLLATTSRTVMGTKKNNM